LISRQSPCHFPCRYARPASTRYKPLLRCTVYAPNISKETEWHVYRRKKFISGIGQVDLTTRHDANLQAGTSAAPRRALAYLLLGGTISFLFLFSMSPVLFASDSAKVAGTQDSHLLNGPRMFFMDSRLAEGDFPLWNPHTYLGVPFAAHPLSQAFYPASLACFGAFGLRGTPLTKS